MSGMDGVDECEWVERPGMGGWSVVGGVITPEAGYAGPRRLVQVEYAGGPPTWKRRALARCPPEDHAHMVALCRADLEDAQKDPAVEYSELPKLASRRQRYYPEDEHIKDNLRIQCLSHYKTTRTAAVKEKEKLILKDRLSNRIHEFFNTTLNPEQFDKYLKTYREPGQPIKTMMPDTSSYRASKYSATKWEEPDTVYGGPSDKKPYSKVETGSSFFSTYGFTNRKKDYVAEEVRNYYYFGDSKKDAGRVRFGRTATKAITDGATDEAAEEKKERRKKKKSKERDLEASTSSVTGAAAAELSTSEADPVSVPAESDAGALDADEEEKERKKLEKKKRKAERETAAKAAMEAELAALAAAEAELARLEAESSKPEAGAPKAAPAEADPAEVKSESAAEKCESSAEVVCEGVSVKPESLGELAPSYTPPQIPPQEEPEATQVFEEPHAAPETEQAVEPQAEEPQPEIPEEEPIMEDLPPLKESVVEYPPVEEPQVEPPVEEPPVEAAPVEAAPEESPVEPLVDEAPVESSVEPSWFEAAPVESPEEPPVDEAPVESSVEPPVEEAPAEPLVEVEQIEEPQAEPALEEPQVEETSVEEPVEMAEEPSLAPQRRTALEEDSGWLDAWDGEAAAPEADAQEAGQQLGTDKSEEPATIQAEEAWPGVQEDTEAAADATATTTDAANAIPDADVAAEAGTDDTADPAEATPSTRFDEDLDE
ncbi:hypothetical protein GWK47_013076 [Chionoecetes opilio]|uniref:Uncharacterized protein n=1 Tax=Chionoecetes opilio TaxID=41210 RepID=A0A8J4XVU4_CHIOP|nr:hypothetical protein GWK47_013076 [Chionoecetes opilio]